jgi:transposase-like protein
MTEPGIDGAGGKKEYTEEERLRVVDLAATGVSNLDIARMLGLHGHTVNAIVNVARRKGSIVATNGGMNVVAKASVGIPIPIQMVMESLKNRVAELSKTTESIQKKGSLEPLPIREIRGELVFMRRLATDIDYLLEQIGKAREA